ncbi:NADPH oxidase, putative, partial [Ixodes scapularis]
KEGFTAENLEHLEQVFRDAVGPNRELSREQFERIVQSRNAFFADRMFQLFDTDRSGTVSLDEFMAAVKRFANKSQDDKLALLFELYDVDGDGMIQPNELRDVMKACMEENGLQFSDPELDELTQVLFEDADRDDTNSISFEELRTQLQSRPGLYENLTTSIERWLLPPRRGGKERLLAWPQDLRWPKKLTRHYARNNYVSMGFCACYLALQVSRVHQLRFLGRASPGQLLNLMCSITALPVLRMCNTWLRSQGASRFLPLDSGIYYHKLTGWLVLAYSIIHTGAHLLNFAARLSEGDWHVFSLYTFTTHHDIGWVGGAASITGWVLLAVLVVMFLCSLPCVRRSGRFEVFYYSHLLYTVFWFFLILHAPNFWKWFLVPGLLLCIEMLVRACRFFSSYGKTTVMKGVILPSKVTPLLFGLTLRVGELSNKRHFVWLHTGCRRKYQQRSATPSSSSPRTRSRQACLAIEQHATERSLYSTLQRLKGASSSSRRFAKNPSHWAQGGTPRSLRVIGVSLKSLWGNSLVRIDGPYGSSSRHIFRAQHAVLIAAGIGVTPFASILQSIMYRYYQARSTCPRCHHCWVEKLPHSIMKLRKVDFIWINRTQQSLEWFVRMLSDLEMEQAMFGDVLERFLDIHIYITSALDRTDMKAVGLHMALDLLHQKDKRCLITGLKRRTQPGRPNWNEASLLETRSARKGKVTVFYCGPPTLSRILHDHCNWNHFAFRKEIF